MSFLSAMNLPFNEEFSIYFLYRIVLYLCKELLGLLCITKNIHNE